MQTVTPVELKNLIDTDAAVLFDIRSEDEFSSEHIPGAVLLPGDQIDENIRVIVGNRDAVFYCSTGVRTKVAAPAIEKAGLAKPHILSGGLNAWRADGLPVVERTDHATRMSIPRQVQLIVGIALLALSAGILSGIPEIAYGTLAIGAGLSFAGLSGTCALARLVMLFPWNRAAR